MVEQVRVPKGISKDDFLTGRQFLQRRAGWVREAVRATVTAGNLRLVPNSASELSAAEGQPPKP
jgi:hypothetical protein